MISSPKGKILVVNQYYAPDVASTGQLAAELCAGLSRRGLDVRVVTGQPSYTAASPPARSYEILEGVRVYRVPLGNSRGRERLIRRLVGYALFLWRAWRKARALATSDPPDSILTFHNPPFVGIIGAALARRHGAGYTYALYDIHPDILTATGWIRLPRAALMFWDRVNRWIFERSNSIVVLSEEMKCTLIQKGVPSDRIHVIPPWARPELQALPPSPALREELEVPEGHVLILYAGNMGVMHPLDFVLDATVACRQLPARFLFVGDGTRRAHLESRVRAEGLPNVQFLPFQPESKFLQLVSAADACLVALEAGMEGLAVPSRAYTFLSAGRPLVVLMSPGSDLARLVSERECGWAVSSAQALAAVVRLLVSNPSEVRKRAANARTLYETSFKKEDLFDRYADVLSGA